MADLDTLLRWAQLDQTEARVDAAYQLRKHAGIPQAQATLVQLLADPIEQVAHQAFSSIVLGDACTPDVCVAGLASPHSSVRDSALARLDRMSLSWRHLTELGLDGSKATALVSNKQLISAILSAEPWRDLAADELQNRDVTDETVADLRTVEVELRRAGRDTTWLTRYFEAKCKEAIRNRRPPRAKPKKTENLNGFLRDIANENVDGADDYVHMLTSGDWVTLHDELAQMEPEDQAAYVDAIGHGPPRGLFILLEHLSGPHAEVVDAAADAIAHMCTIFSYAVALTPDELAIVMRRVPDLVEPFVISGG
jgi:hypothetical protein